MYNWEVAKAYLEENPPIQHDIDSYNEFVDTKMQEVIDEVDERETENGVKIKVHNIRAERPKITEADGAQRKILPHEARLRDRTYSAQLYMEISLKHEEEEIDREEVYVGELPVMLRSKLCYLSDMSEEEMIESDEDPEDPGGYFIINGTERALVGSEELAPNRVMTDKKEKRGKVTTKTRVISKQGRYKPRTTVKRKHRGELKVSYLHSPRHLNLMYLLRALGLETKNEIIEAFPDQEYILNDVILNLGQIEEALEEDPIEALGQRLGGQKPKYTKQHLNRYLLPHIGKTEDVWMNKAYFLVRMAERGIRVAKGKREPSDKDHYANKRVEIAGELIRDQFRLARDKLLKDLKWQIDQTMKRGRTLKVRTLIKPGSLSKRLIYGFKGQKWAGGKKGVAQTLDTDSSIAALSNLRGISSPLNAQRQQKKARDLHGTHYGRICPHETPEGKRVGLVKNLATGCKISSQEIDTEEIKEEILSSEGMEKIKKGE